MVPLSESPPIEHVEVTGRSELILPNEVRAARLYPIPSGMRTRIDENEVFSAMSRQPLAGRIAETSIAPF